MIKVSKNSKVYVYVPANRTAGGAELLHQLVHYLNTYNMLAYIVYIDNGKVVKASIPLEYSGYNINITTEVEDIEQNIVVICEGVPSKIYSTNKAQILFWWLSVDNFFLISAHLISIKDLLNWNLLLGIKQVIKRIVKKIFFKQIPQIISLNKLTRLGALHCYQSNYANVFLANHSFRETLPLSDFLNVDFLDRINSNSIRKDKVLYNPAKGYKYTKKIIDRTPDLEWVPLSGLTREQLVHELQTSKLYVDFGNHPGKDRIPREAALNGCAILTNLKGSAQFFEDVSIPLEYKINQKNTSIEDVIEKIRKILIGYDDIIGDFEFYREKILQERTIFEEQVKEIFRIQS